MNQNINLLASLPAPAPSYLSPKALLKIAFGLILFLIIIYGLGKLSLANLKAKAVNLESTKQQVLAQITTTGKNITNLKEQIAKITLETEGEISSERGDKIKIETASKIGFYGFLKSLAEVTPDDIWFEKLYFSYPENTITLKGITATAALFPKFIENLYKTPSFFSIRFRTLQFEKIKDKTNVNFVLSSAEPEEPPGSKTASTQPKGKPNEPDVHQVFTTH